MRWSELHTRLLENGFDRLLGKANTGAMAFVRCLDAEVVEALARDAKFAPSSWMVRRVADESNEEARTITADRAVELREAKRDAVLLLVDTARAGAGMDGIYSAAREVDERSLFNELLPLAEREITKALTAEHRRYAELSVRRARGFGRRLSVSLWAEFDFLCRVALEKRHPAELLYLLGLWPVQALSTSTVHDDLALSRLFVDRLLGRGAAGLPPARRIESLRLLNPSEQQSRDLELFLRNAATKSLLPVLSELESSQHLWINNLRMEGAAKSIQGIELISWRTNTGRVAKWSGLIDNPDGEGPPILVLNSDAERTGEYSKLEVKWKSRPEDLERGAVDYRVAILTDMDEELASRDVVHQGKKEERCRFSNDDFATLSDDALVSAKVVISVISNETLGTQESEEILIRFGQPPDREPGGAGRKVRTFSEGLIEISDRDAVSDLASTSVRQLDSKGYVIMRTREHGKAFRVFCPPLIWQVDRSWAAREGAIGRWRIKVRASGARASDLEFVPIERPDSGNSTAQNGWDRVSAASRKLADRLKEGSSVGQIYDDRTAFFNSVVKEYLLAWTVLLGSAEPAIALANTVEVQSLSGKTIGLIVLPSHPIRLAWLAAYDNLVFDTAFNQKVKAKDVRDELATLDGAMFPAFLPGLDPASTFVFADTLGFQAAGMVLDTDKEPKAAVAILARALGESDNLDAAPTVSKQSASILGDEFLKYLECHKTGRILHIHALRAGDGFTVARALGRIHERLHSASLEEEVDETNPAPEPSLVLELYPSEEQRAIAGRFIADVRERHRSGAGALAADDQWMLESMSLTGGVTAPRLRWARKDTQEPNTAAHLSVAFDTFDSKVVACLKEEQRPRPLYVFGLMSFFDRRYSGEPYPLWSSSLATSAEGEKHPGDRAHSERLVKIVQAVQSCVSKALGQADQSPFLRTEISVEKAAQLRELHRLSDWVITLDRNGGLEYFDSPQVNRDIYDAYVIDCVPEREDLGCLQLVTSTSNLEEVRALLDVALDQMGLSRSRRNAEFLMWHLKAVSGRLAIRLTGDKAPTSELIALALCHAKSISATDDECWLPLSGGFFIPVDDVRDLLPPLQSPAEIAVPQSRPDLIYVSIVPRKGLTFRFVEVKYRRHLRTARTAETLNSIRTQVSSLRRRWEEWYGTDGVPPSFRSARRAKLARVLRFYADKAHRHYLADEEHDALISEIERMVERGAEYSFAKVDRPDRGWIFCPDYTGGSPLEFAQSEWDGRMFLFGPDLLPDSDIPRLPDASSDEELVTTLTQDERNENPSFSETISSAGSMPEANLSDSSSPSGGEEFLLSDGVPAVSLGTDTLTGEPVRWPICIKGNPHLLMAGLPGMGKTTCLLNICKQMMDMGVRPIIFSYHQDIDQKLVASSRSVRFVDFDGLAFNPLRVINKESKLAHLDVAGAIRDIFVAIYPEIGDLQGERIRRAIKESFAEQGWEGPTHSQASEEPAFDRFLQILRTEPRPDKGLQTLLSRLDELDDYGFFAVREDSGTLWDEDRPIVIRIHSTQNENLQRAFAALVFYSLYKDMFRRGIQDRIRHAVIFDEAHRAAGLKLIPTMAKECRKYGISLVLASQEAKDFQVSLFSAVANYLVLRLTEVDAKALVRNVSNSHQERLLIDRIKQMDRFRALYFSEGKSRPSMVSLAP